MVSKSYMWDIITLAKITTNVLWVKHILFTHAFLGCDTTSRIQNVSKTKLCNDSSERLWEKAELFYDPAATKEDLRTSGEYIAVNVMRKNFVGSLSDLRYKKYLERISKNTKVVTPVRSLGPTSSAFQYHSERVYLQVQVWLGNNIIKPEDWGWKIDNNTMLPITGVENDLICPNDIKILISCGCKLSCNPRYCGCIKNDRKCYEACKNCSGSSCTNYNNEIDEECEYDDESDDDNGIDINSDSDIDSDSYNTD